MRLCKLCNWFWLQLIIYSLICRPRTPPSSSFKLETHTGLFLLQLLCIWVGINCFTCQTAGCVDSSAKAAAIGSGLNCFHWEFPHQCKCLRESSRLCRRLSEETKESSFENPRLTGQVRACSVKTFSAHLILLRCSWTFVQDLTTLFQKESPKSSK